MVVQRWMIWKSGMRRRALVRRTLSGNRHSGFGFIPRLLMICLMLCIIGISITGCAAQPPKAQPAPTTPGVEAYAPAAIASGEETGAQPTAGSQPEAGLQPPAQPALTSPEGAAVITFATYSFLEEAYKPILEEFHKQYPMITVQMREAPQTADTRELASAADTTLLLFRPPNGGSHFLDLTSLAEGDPGFQPGSYWPGILEACKDAEGRAYGLPISVEPTGIYYQEKAFAYAGLPLPKPGWTWEDFQKAVPALTGTKDGLPVYGFADDSFIDTPDETLLSPRISYLLEQNGGKIDVKRFENELGWYLNLIQSGGLYSANIYPQQSPLLIPENKEAWSSALNDTWLRFHELFLNHPPAMWKGRLLQIYWKDVDIKALPDGSLNMGAASGLIMESKPEIGWVPFPVSADGQNDHTTPNTVTCGVISAGTQYPRAAWIWLNYLAAHPGLPDWSLDVPAQPAAAKANGYWLKLPEKYREPVRFGVEHGWYRSPYPQAVMAVNQALLKAVAENADLQEALVDASARTETALLPTPDAAPIVVAPPKPTAVPSATTIDYFALSFGADERVKRLAEEFHSLHPDVTVQVDSPSSMLSAAKLVENYDCFSWLPENDLPTHQLYDLNQFLFTEAIDPRSEFSPETVKDFSQNGKLYGLPSVYRPTMVYYNADLLNRLGMKPPALDWTYADFIAPISAASDSSASSPVYGLALEYPSPDFYLFLAGQNADLVDTGGAVPAYRFDALETGSAVQWLAEQVKAGVIYPITPFPIGSRKENLMDARRLILDGRVAFWISYYDHGQGGSYALREAGFPIGIAPLPRVDGRVPWQPHHLSIGQYISRRSANPQVPRACWDWIKFLSEQPDSSFGVPARRSVRDSQEWAAQVGPEAARAYQAALDLRDSERGAGQENAYALGPTRDWWNETLAEVVHGASPTPLLAALQKKADAYSACLAASADYQSGDAEQRAQAVTTCAERAGPK